MTEEEREVEKAQRRYSGMARLSWVLMNEEECSRGVMSHRTANYPSVTLAVTSVITISFCLSKVMRPHPPAELG